NMPSVNPALTNTPSTHCCNPHLLPSVAPSGSVCGTGPADPSTPSRVRHCYEAELKTITFAECQVGNPAAPVRRSLRVELLGALAVVDAEFVNGWMALCDLVYKAGATPRDPSFLDNGQVIALAMQLGGHENPVPCRACQISNLFAQCVGSNNAGNGECAGCKFLANPGRCNFRK
ncbi:hypothetical protein KEM55_004577, partial [Ascosphaera atra]